MYWWRDPHRQKLFYQCRYDGLVPKTSFIYDFFFSDKKSKDDLDVSTVNYNYKVHKSIGPSGFLTINICSDGDVLCMVLIIPIWLIDVMWTYMHC